MHAFIVENILPLSGKFCKNQKWDRALKRNGVPVCTTSLKHSTSHHKKMCRGFLLPQLVKYFGDISFLVEQWLPLRQMHLSLGALCIMTGAYCST